MTLPESARPSPRSPGRKAQRPVRTRLRAASRRFHGAVAPVHRVFGWLAAQLRVLVLCAYPIVGTAIVFYVSAFSDQGVDLLFNALDQLSLRHDVARQTLGSSPLTVVVRALLSGLSVVVAALSIWWPARLLLQREFRYFPIDRQRTSRLRAWLPALLAAAVLVGVAVGYGRIAWRVEQWQPGAFAALWAAAAVVLSAVLLHVRPSEGPGELSNVKAGVIVGFCLAYVVLALAFAAWPVVLPRAFGGTALVFFGVGGLTFIATMTIAYLPLSQRRPSWTVLATLYLLVVSSWLDNHAMRPSAADTQALPLPLAPLQRAQAWEQARRGSGCRRDGDTPVLYVAAAGGGIRAAYWTTRVLEELSLQLGPDFDCALFALSGVSGGSLGVAAYVAVNRDRVATAAAAATAASTAAAPPDARHRASQSLGEDFLSPAVAGLLFYDALQRVVPVPFAALDRSRGLESAFEDAFAWVDGEPMRRPLRALDRGAPGLPMVLLNATVVEDGRRAIQSNVDLAGFVDVYDLDCPRLPRDRAPSTALISLAGAVHNSARFTYVSPAGRVARLGDCAGAITSDARIVDGGYFENSGAATLTQLLCSLYACDRPPVAGVAGVADVARVADVAGVADVPASPPTGEATAGQRTRPVLLLVRNSPGTRPYCAGTHADDHCLSLSADPARPTPLRPAHFLPEVVSPLQALLTVREQRERLAVVAAAEAFRSRGGVVVEAYLPLQEKTLPDPPLGWSLSPGVRAALDDGARTIVEGCRGTLAALFAGGALRSGCDRPDAAQAASTRATRIATERPAAASAVRAASAAQAASARR